MEQPENKVENVSKDVSQPVINQESEMRGCIEGLTKLFVTVIEIVIGIVIYVWLTGGSIQVKQDCLVIKVPPIAVDTCTVTPAQ